MPGRRSLVELEIKQTKPFESTAIVPIISVMRTANLLERFYNSLLEAHDLTFQQFNVLTILRGAEPKGHPTLEVANRLIAAAPGVTRLIDRLVKKRLVKRRRGPDRRQVICRITPAGLELLADIYPTLIAADDAVMAPLSKAERVALTGLLDRVRGPLVHPTSPAE